MPLFFLIASGAVSFGVFTVLKNQTRDASAKGARSKDSPPSRIFPEDHLPSKPTTPSQPESTPSLPVQAPEQPLIVDPQPIVPEGIEPTTPAQAAEDVLDKFLSAKTLAERMPLIETLTSESDLTKSCLAAPLPAASNILTDAQEGNAVEQVIDIYYNVDFDAGNNALNSQTILVRKRGTSDPKIVVDPFLDSYGGRLAAYAKTSSDKAGTFQVIISAVASCNDERVPNRDKKLTLKLLPRDNTKEIARAYFGRQSKIGMMLEDGTYSLSYGKAKACTVVLRWNVEDNPQTPYLEAIDLKTLDWNP